MPRRANPNRTPVHVVVHTLTDDVAVRTKAIDRFWTLVDRPVGDGCWLWTGPCPRLAHARHGEPLFLLGRGQNIGARRFAFILAHGSVPAFCKVLRRRPGCHPRCVRPDADHAVLAYPSARGFHNTQRRRRVIALAAATERGAA